MRKKPFRPTLERLEGRDLPSTWVGWQTGSTDWSLPANWDDGHVPSTSADAARFTKDCAQDIVCPVSALGSLTIDNGSGVGLHLTLGGLTLSSSLGLAGGQIDFTAAGDSLTLAGAAGTWTDGQLGTSTGPVGNLVIRDGGTLSLGTSLGVGVEPFLDYANVFVGTTPDLAAASRGTLTLSGVNWQVGNAVNITVGNSATTNGQAVFNLSSDANGNPSNVRQYSGSPTTAQLVDYGNVNVNAAPGAGGAVQSQTIDMPALVKPNGAFGVFSHNALTLNSDAASAFAFDDQGVANVGVKTPQDSGDGTAGVTCSGKGSIVEAGAGLTFYGPRLMWSDSTLLPNGLELAISGYLSLWSTGSYEQTRLEITDGNLHFTSGGQYNLQGLYGTGGAPSYDKIILDVGQCQLDQGATVTPTAFGVPSNTDWVPIDLLGAGVGIQGTPMTLNTPGWRESFFSQGGFNVAMILSFL